MAPNTMQEKHSSLYTDKVTDKIRGLGKDRHTDIHRQQEQSVLKKKKKQKKPRWPEQR